MTFSDPRMNRVTEENRIAIAGTAKQPEAPPIERQLLDLGSQITTLSEVVTDILNKIEPYRTGMNDPKPRDEPPPSFLVHGGSQTVEHIVGLQNRMAEQTARLRRAFAESDL